jgi:hypothetical protein
VSKVFIYMHEKRNVKPVEFDPRRGGREEVGRWV